ncbi:MAG: nitronate monooxygenase [Proteiniphilum sp.]|nr:nitronate monooxygenase [Proteiniphilum sp.]
MNELKIGDLTAKLPIIQGGMGVCVSMSGLAAAVANEGGIGVISAVGIGMSEPDYRKHFRASNKIALRKQIQKAQLNSNGIIGVNIMMAVSDFDDLLQVALEEKIDIVFIGAGLPLKIPAFLESINQGDTTTKIVPKVSSSRAAKLIFRHWLEKYNKIPDAVVVEGPLAGGHLGFGKDDLNNSKQSLYSIVKDTVDEMDFFQQKTGVEIPVIAAGGIYTGRDMYNIMQSGAKAVKMGTRFVTTTECDVSEEFKQNYLNCTKDDIVLIDSPVGLPGRVIINDFVREIQQGEQKPVKCPWKCLKTCDYKKVQFCISEALFNAAQGNFKHGFSFAGTNAFLAKEIITVKETMQQLKEEYYHEEMRLKKVEVCEY